MSHENELQPKCLHCWGNEKRVWLVGFPWVAISRYVFNKQMIPRPYRIQAPEEDIQIGKPRTLSWSSNAHHASTDERVTSNPLGKTDYLILSSIFTIVLSENNFCTDARDLGRGRSCKDARRDTIIHSPSVLTWFIPFCLPSNSIVLLDKLWVLYSYRLPPSSMGENHKLLLAIWVLHSYHLPPSSLGENHKLLLAIWVCWATAKC